MPAKKEKTSEKPEKTTEKSGSGKKKTKTSADKNLEVPKRLQVTTKTRTRKEVHRFADDVSDSSRGGAEEIVIKKGKGKKLEDIPNVVAQINKRTTKDELLRMVHTLLLGRVNKKSLS